MWLDNENREEALEILKALGVEESRLKYMKFFDSGAGWMHKFEGYLGGRDGWSGLHIDKGPDFDCDDYKDNLDDEDWIKDHVVYVNDTEYHIYEGD